MPIIILCSLFKCSLLMRNWTCLRHRSLQILIFLGIYLAIAPWIPGPVHQGLYTCSLFLKDTLLWMLPFTVGCFIAYALCSFEKKAPLFLLILVLFEAFSNFSSVWYSYFCGHLTLTQIPPVATSSDVSTLEPLWRIPFTRPSWWSADKGSLAGVILGLLANLALPSLRHPLLQGKKIAEWVLTRCFSKLIPLFVLGFVARMHQTHTLQNMVEHYAELLLWLVLFLSCYLCFLLALSSGFSWKRFLQNSKNLLPATGIAFSSGCSLSTMPWTIEGVKKSLRDPSLAQAVIPATTNIQQIGDCLTNSFLCFLLFTYFHGYAPDIALWLPFTCVFVLARFATAAVLGGAIFIMIPIYESYLHFTPEMITLMLTFNVLLDPLITCANVLANGTLCLLFEKVWLRLARPQRA